MFAKIREIVCGRAGAYEKSSREALDTAIGELPKHAVEFGAEAVLGLRVDVEPIGGRGMIMVIATGTAVRLDA